MSFFAYCRSLKHEINFYGRTCSKISYGKRGFLWHFRPPKSVKSLPLTALSPRHRVRKLLQLIKKSFQRRKNEVKSFTQCWDISVSVRVSFGIYRGPACLRYKSVLVALFFVGMSNHSKIFKGDAPSYVPAKNLEGIKKLARGPKIGYKRVHQGLGLQELMLDIGHQAWKYNLSET